MGKLVALDIGHGSDTREKKRAKYVYRNGKYYEEHDANSDVGIRVKKILEAHGVKVWLPQQPYSPEVELIDRTNKANYSIKPDLYWSIHFNAGSSNVKGVCSFYWHTASEAKKLCQAFAKNAQAAGITTHGNGIHESVPNSWTNLHIVRETNMTAVLTENGFQTNDEEFEKIHGKYKDQYRQLVAEVNAKTILSYFGINMGKVKTTAPSVPDNGLLGVGDTGAAVKELQKRLTALGYDTKGIDGDFGPNTNSALKDFQEDHDCDVDGIAGPQVFKALDAAEKKVADAKKKAAEKAAEEKRKAEEKKKAEQAKKEEEDEMLETAIVINTYNDYPAAELVALKHKAPIYPRKAIVGEVAKHIIVVGGNKDGIKADKITVLAGPDRIATVKAVEKYIK